MSISLPLNSLSARQRDEIQRLRLELLSKFSTYTKYIYPQRVDYELGIVSVPFYWAQQTLEVKRPKKKHYPSMSTTAFDKPLRPEQIEIRSEAIAYLNGNKAQNGTSGSCLISAYCGFGKCLGYDTKVLFYDGRSVPVQSIRTGDVLMGDDGMPRRVLQIDRGRSKMYRLKPINIFDTPSNLSGEFTANGDHILCLYNTSSDEIEEISIDDYLKLDLIQRQIRLAYRIAPMRADVNIRKFNNFECYNIGWTIGSTYNVYSTQLPFPTGRDKKINPRCRGCVEESPTIEAISQIGTRSNRLALLAGFMDQCGSFEKTIYKYKLWLRDHHRSYIFFLCRSLGIKVEIGLGNTIWIEAVFIPCLNSKLNANRYRRVPIERPSRYAFSVEPIGYGDYYGFLIDENHRFLLGDFTVTHNTCVSINLACVIGLRTLIIANKLILLKQWMDSLQFFAPQTTKTLLLPTTTSADDDSDFYVINAENVPKLVHTGVFASIGLVIVDEAHLIMAETLSKSLQHVNPCYLIGLSATPYREDGLGTLLDLYFGPDRIVRKLERKHTVWLVKTGFKPEVELTQKGKLNWGVLLDSLSTLPERNQLIEDLLCKFSDRVFLVLVKRVAQGEDLLDRLRERGQSVTSLLGSNQQFDVNARILIGTSSKIGVGFDHPRLDALLLAADVEQYFIQYLGRVFRTQQVEPIVIDILDDHPILFKHYKTRSVVYKESGGRIRTFSDNTKTTVEPSSLLTHKLKLKV